MATLADLKAEICDDLARTDLMKQVETQISRAIAHYQGTRFWFNESRAETFSTVAGQQDYPYGDTAAITDFIHIDALFSTISTTVRQLRMVSPEEIETLGGVNVTTGEPTSYALFDRMIRLYPAPDKAYSMRLQGHIRLAEPATDTEATNVWLNNAYDLIRCRAKKMIALHITRDADMVQAMDAGERSAVDALYVQTAMRIGSGFIRATTF